jgi:hypothetical protein
MLSQFLQDHNTVTVRRQEVVVEEMSGEELRKLAANVSAELSKGMRIA